MSNKNTVQNAVYQELKKGIMTLHLVPGTEMSTQEIATKLQVSRTPVREALRQLEMDGLIENIPNRGAFVLGLSKQDIEDMYVLRKAYEV